MVLGSWALKASGGTRWLLPIISMRALRRGLFFRTRNCRAGAYKNLPRTHSIFVGKPFAITNTCTAQKCHKFKLYSYLRSCSWEIWKHHVQGARLRHVMDCTFETLSPNLTLFYGKHYWQSSQLFFLPRFLSWEITFPASPITQWSNSFNASASSRPSTAAPRVRNKPSQTKSGDGQRTIQPPPGSGVWA